MPPKRKVPQSFPEPSGHVAARLEAIPSEAVRTRPNAVGARPPPSSHPPEPRWESENFRDAIDSCCGASRQAIAALVTDIWPSDMSSKFMHPNPSSSLRELYHIASGTTDDEEMSHRAGEWLQYPGVHGTYILRALAAASLEALVFRRDTPDPWATVQKTFAKLGSNETYLIAALRVEKVDFARLCRRMHLGRAETMVPPDRVVAHALALADEFIGAFREHLDFVNSSIESRGIDLLVKRMPRFRYAMRDFYIGALRLKERVIATCPGARLVYYWGEDVHIGRMYEEGVEPRDTSNLGGTVAITLKPGLAFDEGLMEGAPSTPLVKACVCVHRQDPTE